MKNSFSVSVNVDETSLLCSVTVVRSGSFSDIRGHCDTSQYPGLREVKSTLCQGLSDVYESQTHLI